MMDMRLDGETNPKDEDFEKRMRLLSATPCHDYFPIDPGAPKHSPFGSVNRQRMEAEADLAILAIRTLFTKMNTEQRETLRDEWPGLYHAIAKLVQVT